MQCKKKKTAEKIVDCVSPVLVHGLSSVIYQPVSRRLGVDTKGFRIVNRASLSDLNMREGVHRSFKIC